MAYKTLGKVLEELDGIAAELCSCTKDQQSGKDPSLCRSCDASRILNEIEEDAKFGLRSLTKADEPEP